MQILNLAQAEYVASTLNLKTKRNGVENYTNWLRFRYSTSRLLGLVDEYATQVDPDTGDPEQMRPPSDLSFYRGGLLGIKVVDLVGGRSMRRKSASFTVPPPQNINRVTDEEYIYWQAAAVTAASTQGYQSVEPLHPLIDRWTEELGSSTDPHKLKLGFGLVMYLLNEATQREKLKASVKAAENFDWDSAAAELKK